MATPTCNILFNGTQYYDSNGLKDAIAGVGNTVNFFFITFLTVCMMISTLISCGANGLSNVVTILSCLCLFSSIANAISLGIKAYVPPSTFQKKCIYNATLGNMISPPMSTPFVKSTNCKIENNTVSRCDANGNYGMMLDGVLQPLDPALYKLLQSPPFNSADCATLADCPSSFPLGFLPFKPDTKCPQGTWEKKSDGSCVSSKNITEMIGPPPVCPKNNSGLSRFKILNGVSSCL